MEELLRNFLPEIRGLIPTWNRSQVEVARLWGQGYFPKGTRWHSVELAMESQINAGFGGRVLQHGADDLTLANYQYGINPALDTPYRYTVRIECTNMTNGLKLRSALVLPEGEALTAGEIREAASTRIDLIRGGDLSPWFSSTAVHPEDLTCDYEIVGAERRG